jgi:hypothetical protein
VAVAASTVLEAVVVGLLVELDDPPPHAETTSTRAMSAADTAVTASKRNSREVDISPPVARFVMTRLLLTEYGSW